MIGNGGSFHASQTPEKNSGRKTIESTKIALDNSPCPAPHQNAVVTWESALDWILLEGVGRMGQVSDKQGAGLRTDHASQPLSLGADVSGGWGWGEKKIHEPPWEFQICPQFSEDKVDKVRPQVPNTWPLLAMEALGQSLSS